MPKYAAIVLYDAKLKRVDLGEHPSMDSACQGQGGLRSIAQDPLMVVNWDRAEEALGTLSAWITIQMTQD